jgi:hypothetical protein
MSDQLAFDLEPNGNGRKFPHELGLRKCGPGAERLLSKLLQRGLSERDLKVAAALCLLLDEGAKP